MDDLAAGSSFVSIDETGRLVGEPYRTRCTGGASHAPVPTMLLWGKHDQVIPIEQLDAVRDLLRPDECHVIDSGHMVPFEDPHGAALLLAAFIQRNTGGRPA
jgi:pimeloyl-ACP methyl ester carboxylesterase